MKKVLEEVQSTEHTIKYIKTIMRLPVKRKPFLHLAPVKIAGKAFKSYLCKNRCFLPLTLLHAYGIVLYPIYTYCFSQFFCLP
jgi:hypothetical protein